MKRKKKPIEPNQTLMFLELQLSVMQVCQSLKAVTNLLIEKKYEAAIARLDGATSALAATIPGQCVCVVMECKKCQTDQSVVAWVDEKTCQECGAALEIPDPEWHEDDEAKGPA